MMMDALSSNPDITMALTTIENQQVPVSGTAQTETEAKKAAEDFEAFFLTQVFQHMFEGVKTDGPFGGGHAEKMFRSMMLDEYGKMVAHSGGVGIADDLMTSILASQEQESVKQ